MAVAEPTLSFAATPGVAHRIAADLIEEGISVDEVYRFVYDTVPQVRLHLLGDVLQTLDTTEDAKIAWLSVTQDVLKKNGASSNDLEGFVNYIRSIDSVEVAIVANELETGDTKISMRSKTNVDVGQICRLYDGGGHVRAAGCLIQEPLYEALAQIVANTRLHIDGWHSESE